MKRRIIFLLLTIVTTALHAQTFEDLSKMQKYEGYFNFYYNSEADQICLIVEDLEQEFLYVHSLSSGVGSNDLGLDRGQLGGQEVVYFRKAGNKLLLIQPNLKYRAETDNKLERDAVEQAFAKSVLYGFEILDQDKGKHLIDLSSMLFSDTHGVAERLEGMQQGNYLVDLSRSAIELNRTKAFPKNVEFEALITLTGKPTGRLIRNVTPNASHVSVVQHHSFVELPDKGYQPRVFHPQSGCIPVSYMDYATPIYEPLKKHFIMRHRLSANEPIVYYLDNGTPEPVRSALLEGGRWWQEAFSSIGYDNAFRMEILPEDADPLDVRYNVVQWVHRSTRGWSYGGAVIDPRTGEIIKGHVSLGSQRIRQDFMIAQALVNRPFASDPQNHQAMMELALARIRQLSAHEIGHTLGFTHNFAASSNNRSSVMDYPHPMVYMEGGEVMFDRAYDEGIGDWDKVTVAYAYSEFKGEKNVELEKILAEARNKGLRFISDNDARAAGGAHPYAHLWDNGKSAIEELENVLELRSTALRNFSIDNIREGEPHAVLEDIFVPLYFFHRYQVEAVSKMIGGLEYTYAVKGDGSQGPKALNGDLQREALEKALFTLSPEVLMIPQEIIALFPPRPPGYSRTRESFDGKTGITFDYLAPAAAAANLTLEFLLHPQRANRLVLQRTLDDRLPGLNELLESLLISTLLSAPGDLDYRAELMYTVNFIVIDHLIRLANDPVSYPQVKAIVEQHLSHLKEKLVKEENKGVSGAYKTALIKQIEENKVKHLDHLPELPPGAPIGMECMDH
jgi:hypothetical protein